VFFLPHLYERGLLMSDFIMPSYLLNDKKCTSCWLTL